MFNCEYCGKPFLLEIQRRGHTAKCSERPGGDYVSNPDGWHSQKDGEDRV